MSAFAGATMTVDDIPYFISLLKIIDFLHDFGETSGRSAELFTSDNFILITNFLKLVIPKLRQTQHLVTVGDAQNLFKRAVDIIEEVSLLTNASTTFNSFNQSNIRTEIIEPLLHLLTSNNLRSFKKQDDADLEVIRFYDKFFNGVNPGHVETVYNTVHKKIDSLKKTYEHLKMLEKVPFNMMDIMSSNSRSKKYKEVKAFMQEKMSNSLGNLAHYFIKDDQFSEILPQEYRDMDLANRVLPANLNQVILTMQQNIQIKIPEISSEGMRMPNFIIDNRHLLYHLYEIAQKTTALTDKDKVYIRNVCKILGITDPAKISEIGTRMKGGNPNEGRLMYWPSTCIVDMNMTPLDTYRFKNFTKFVDKGEVDECKSEVSSNPHASLQRCDSVQTTDMGDTHTTQGKVQYRLKLSKDSFSPISVLGGDYILYLGEIAGDTGVHIHVMYKHDGVEYLLKFNSNGVKDIITEICKIKAGLSSKNGDLDETEIVTLITSLPNDEGETVADGYSLKTLLTLFNTNRLNLNTQLGILMGLYGGNKGMGDWTISSLAGVLKIALVTDDTWCSIHAILTGSCVIYGDHIFNPYQEPNIDVKTHYEVLPHSATRIADAGMGLDDIALTVTGIDIPTGNIGPLTIIDFNENFYRYHKKYLKYKYKYLKFKGESSKLLDIIKKETLNLQSKKVTQKELTEIKNKYLKYKDKYTKVISKKGNILEKKLQFNLGQLMQNKYNKVINQKGGTYDDHIAEAEGAENTINTGINPDLKYQAHIHAIGHRTAAIAHAGNNHALIAENHDMISKHYTEIANMHKANNQIDDAMKHNQFAQHHSGLAQHHSHYSQQQLAHQHIQQSIIEDRQRNLPASAYHHSMAADTFSNIGDHVNAAIHYNESAKRLHAIQDHRGAAHHFALAGAASTRAFDNSRAREHFDSANHANTRAAEKLIESRKDSELQHRDDYISAAHHISLIAKLHEQVGKHEEAAQHYSQAAKHLCENSRNDNDLVQCHELNAKVHELNAKVHESNGDLMQAAVAHKDASVSYRNANNLSKALHHAKKALTQQVELRQDIGKAMEAEQLVTTIKELNPFAAFFNVKTVTIAD
jgi:hypothetical protein